MKTKEYLTEQNYQQSNIKIKKTGKTLLIIGGILMFLGIILVVIGFLNFGNAATNTFDSVGNVSIESTQNIDTSDFFNSSTSAIKTSTSNVFGSIGLTAIGGFIGAIGFLTAAVGGILLIVSHRREITAYTTQQVMPIAKEEIEKMAPTLGDAVGTIAKGITKGIKEGKKDSNE